MRTIGCDAWIRGKVMEGVSNSQLYHMFNQFKKATGSKLSYENYKCSVRRVARGVRPKPEKEGAPVKFNKEVKGPDTTIVTTSSKIKTLDQLLSYARVDLDKYKVDRHTINQWTTYSTKLGEVIPLENYQVKAWLSEIETAEDEQSEIDEIEAQIEAMQAYAPQYPTLIPKPAKSGNALEIALFDHHFGQLSWGKETGDKNYNIKISHEMAMTAISDILNKAKHYDIDQIFIPIGNDFFNVNDQTNTTQKGTPQSEDDRWQKTFVSGRMVWVNGLELCRSIAPTKGLWVPGNHDPERSFHLCDSLYCWFKNSDIEIDHSPKAQKVIEWGKNAIMYSHGCNERPADYPTVFATTFPQEFARSKYRAIHLGDKHHTKKSALTVNEDVYAVDVKIKPTLVPLNAWSSGKAYKAIARTEAEIWNKEDGLIADLYYQL